MNLNKTVLLVTLVLSSYSAYSDYDVEKKVMEKNNTGLNRNQEMTAEVQARGTKSDVEMTRKLRERLMADDQLSTSAHNIKIITVKGAITLQGPVASKEEKMKIENLARSMSGKKKIYNRLTY
jgi:osmotically-inducible protein OsmY